MKFLACLTMFASFCLIAQSAANTIATNARLLLLVPPDRAPLASVKASIGSVGEGSWLEDEAQKRRLSDIIFPATWWRWSECRVEILAQEDCQIELRLTGPWAVNSEGDILRQEIIWDDLEAAGAELKNGGFEILNSDGQPEHWFFPYRNPIPPDQWPRTGESPRSGAAYGHSWHDRPLAQTLELRANSPVTLTLRARAAVPPGKPLLQPLSGETAAHRASAKIRRGMNLSNRWEAPPPDYWGVAYSIEDIEQIAREGFDHIRVPVAWHYHLKEDGKGGLQICEDLLAELRPILQRALERNLHIIVNWHHYDSLTSDPYAHREHFLKGWQTIAKYFAEWPESLWFELLNEPRDAANAEVINELYAATIPAIRAISPQRILVVSPADWGSVYKLERLILPKEDDRIVVTFHNYTPYYFTHQGASWSNLYELSGIVYPGPPKTPFELPHSLANRPELVSFINRYNTLPTEHNPSSEHAFGYELELAKSWSTHFGRPIHLGEFGAHRVADLESRKRYLEAVRRRSEELQIPWTLWDWKSLFGYWDVYNNVYPFREALFGQ